MPILVLFLVAVIASASFGYYLGDTEADESKSASVREVNGEQRAIVYTNRENALVLETQVAPGAIYDVMLWNYDRQFADDIGLGPDLVFYIDPPQEGVKAIGLSATTAGMQNVCGLHLLMDATTDLLLPKETWNRGQRTLSDLLMVSRGFIDPNARRVANDASMRSLTREVEAYSGHRYNVIYEPKSPDLPNGTVSLRLMEVNYSFRINDADLLYLKFNADCHSLWGGIAASAEVEKHNIVALGRSNSWAPEVRRRQDLLDDQEYFRFVRMPETLLERGRGVFADLAEDDRQRRRYVWRAGELVSQMTLAPQEVGENLE